MKNKLVRNLGIVMAVAAVVLFANIATASEVDSEAAEVQEETSEEGEAESSPSVDEEVIAAFEEITAEESSEEVTDSEEENSAEEILSDEVSEETIDEAEDSEHDWTYTSNEDGTHTKTCSECEDEVTEDCSFEDGKCIYCGFEKEEESDNKLELEDQTISVDLGSYELKIKGKMPKNTKVSVAKNDDYAEMTRRVVDSLASETGFLEEESYALSFTYESEDGTKEFVPTDFDEEYTASISGLGKTSAYAVGCTCQCANDPFHICERISVTFGKVYSYKSSIYGKMNDKCGQKVYAAGKGVTYSTVVNDRGEYLFTDVDYSKGYFGMCFEIYTES